MQNIKLFYNKQPTQEQSYLEMWGNLYPRTTNACDMTLCDANGQKRKLSEAERATMIDYLYRLNPKIDAIITLPEKL